MNQNHQKRKSYDDNKNYDAKEDKSNDEYEGQRNQRRGMYSRPRRAQAIANLRPPNINTQERNQQRRRPGPTGTPPVDYDDRDISSRRKSKLKSKLKSKRKLKRKSKRKSRRKSKRKSKRKSRRKSRRKSKRKSKRKSRRKSMRKSKRKSMRKSRRKGNRKSKRKGMRKGMRKTKGK